MVQSLRKANKTFFLTLSALVLTLASVGFPVVALADTPEPTVISLGNGNVLPNGNSTNGRITPDGRYVAFSSFATNLVPNYTPPANPVQQTYVHDTLSGETELISVNNAGIPANESSGALSITPEGRFVLFRSPATNLPNNSSDGECFIRDRQLGTTSVISPYNNRTGSSCSAISDDGNLVVFSADPPTGWPGYFCPHFPCNWSGSNGYILNRSTGIMKPVAVDVNGQYGFVESESVWHSYQSLDVRMSGDGTKVTFISASKLVPDLDDSVVFRAYQLDLSSGNLQLITPPASSGQIININSGLNISRDGKFVIYNAFNSSISNSSIYIHNLQTGTDEQVNVGHAGEQPNGISYEPSISSDGTYVAFRSSATNLVPGTAPGDHVFVRNMSLDITKQGDFNVAAPHAFAGVPQLADSGAFAFSYSYYVNDVFNLQVYLSPAPQYVPEPVTGLTGSTPTNNPTVSWGAVSNTTYYKLYRNGLEVGTATSTNFTDTGLGIDGTYSYSVAACNGFGCSAQSTPLTVMYDATLPLTGIPNWSANPLVAGTQTTLTLSSTDNLSGIVGGEYFVDTDPGVGNALPLTVSPSSLSASFGSNLTPGVYTVGVRALDAAGNWSQTTFDYLVVFDPAGPTDTVGKKSLTPTLANGDVLHGLINTTQTDKATFGFDVRYTNSGAVDPTSDFSFLYETGKKCNSPNPENCHSFLLTANSFAWLSVNGTNNSSATFQGYADLVVDGVSTNVVFKVTVLDGDRLTPIVADNFSMKIYAQNANPETDAPLYQATADVNNGSNLKIQ